VTSVSLIILRQRNLLSSSWSPRVDPGAKFIDYCLTLARSTGSKKEMIASCICKITLWFVEMLSAMKNRFL